MEKDQVESPVEAGLDSPLWVLVSVSLAKQEDVRDEYFPMRIGMREQGGTSTELSQFSPLIQDLPGSAHCKPGTSKES